MCPTKNHTVRQIITSITNRSIMDYQAKLKTALSLYISQERPSILPKDAPHDLHPRLTHPSTHGGKPRSHTPSFIDELRVDVQPCQSIAVRLTQITQRQACDDGAWKPLTATDGNFGMKQPTPIFKLGAVEILDERQRNYTREWRTVVITRPLGRKLISPFQSLSVWSC